MLEPIGIDAADEGLYRTLLARSQATAEELSDALGRSPGQVEEALSRLERLGLVHRMPGRPIRMRAARPDVALSVLVSRRQEELARTQLAAQELLALMPADVRHRPEDVVEVVVGRQAIAARFDQLLSDTRDELLVLDRPPYVSDTARAEATVTSMLRSDVRVRGIYAPEALELPGALQAVQDAVRAGEESRVHRQIPMKLAIGDRRLAILPVGADEEVDAAFCIRPSGLLDALVQLFELLWQGATPVVAPAPEDQFGDRELIALLASGAKDDVVARHLGTSTRTLSRRISQLMERLQVRTRFQAGVQAVRLGWLDGAGPGSADGEGPDDRLVQDGAGGVGGVQPQ